jgi:uncharacterized LabA/DUF88 family protein
MSFPARYAILLDGGFVIKKLQALTGRFPVASDVEQLCNDLRAHPGVKDLELLRIYFYHAQPANGVLANPIDKSTLNLATTTVFAKHESLLDTLELTTDFSVRLGETATHGWRLGSSAMRSLAKAARPVAAGDLVPNISQKGVDLRIGLDIARLSLKEMVRAIVVVTGDSDLIPAFKFARREGVRVYLATLRHGVTRDLKAHADVVI